jgi:protein-tyrosine phosphatase
MKRCVSVHRHYYRSRFAEHLFNALAPKHGLSWMATSRGLALERA